MVDAATASEGSKCCVKCLTCNQVLPSSAFALVKSYKGKLIPKRHCRSCAAVIRASRTRTITCADCGVEHVIRRDSTAERCKSCAGRLGGARAWANVKAARAPTFCVGCGKEMPRNAQGRRQQHCSNACRNAGRSIERSCETCGTIFRVWNSKKDGARNSAGRFCSKGCYSEWQTTDGANAVRGSRWKRSAQTALAAAPFCAGCGSTHRLDVHHIIPWRHTRDNAQENLLPLCKIMCHPRADVAFRRAELVTGFRVEQGAAVQAALRRMQEFTREQIARGESVRAPTVEEFTEITIEALSGGRVVEKVKDAA